MSLQVVSSSAGSGKTFYITMFYIYIALQDEKNYEKILALTFTNAAVNEKKNRILEKLHKLAKGNEETIREYTNFVEQEFNEKINDVNELKLTSQKVFQHILFHYYNFSVLTIDSFLQKILASSLFEIGFNANYDLIIEIDPLIEKAVEEFLLNENTENTILEWISEFIAYRSSVDKNVQIKNEIIQLAKEINKEFFYFHQDIFKEKKIFDYEYIKNTLDEFMDEFVQQINNFSQKFKDLRNKANLNIENFKNGNRGFANVFENKFSKFEKGDKITDIKTNSLENFFNQKEWFAKDKKNVGNFKQYEEEFEKLSHEISTYLNDNAIKYETYRIIKENIFNIGLIHKVVQVLDEYKKNNSQLLLSDIAKIIIDFIKENYLFIYEKLGIKYEYFLIDEFQDTSTLQYNVIKPLIDESLSNNASGIKAIMVGDIKQAIYRWRNGEWELMNSQLKKDYPQLISKKLDKNWRSCKNIIEFNNIFFQYFANNESLKNNFSDVKQLYPNKSESNDGYVKILFEEKADSISQESLDDEEKNGRYRWLINEVQELINKNYQQIGILVRKNIEAQEVFQLLTQEKNITNQVPIISKESITLKNSIVVESIMHILHYFYTSSSLSFYAASELIKPNNSDIVDTIVKKLEEHKYSSLLTKVELMYSQLSKHVNFPVGELIFYNHFISMLADSTLQFFGSDLAFIAWYFDEGRNNTIQLTGKEKGIFIETIHSSKGLQFDAVIIPSISWDSKANNLNPDYLWVENACSTIKNELPILFLTMKKDLEHTIFKDCYCKEQEKKEIDDTNLLYVAFTRAKYAMIAKVYNKGIGKKVKEIFDNNDFKNAEINVNGINCKIDDFYKNQNTFELGSLSNRDSFSLDIIKDFSFNTKDVLYFNENRNLIVKQSENFQKSDQQIYGEIIHAILEQVQSTQWQNVAKKVLNEYQVSDDLHNNIMEKLNKLFSPESLIIRWLKTAKKIYSERNIYNINEIRRPDKIFIFDESVIVVDFKASTIEVEASYKQISEYCQLLKQLNYKNVKAYLIYVETNEYKEVSV
ncbi:MAG: UvrD-helicase domain-containing protein [Bacteroidales bacterium]|nr:UvrD-helicase domain-containing protein [Bacteroidales bacterium]